MKLFLDENITPKAQEFFQSLGYDVVSVNSLGLKGMTDLQVFFLASKDKRILITHNGKDFIIQIPPLRMQVSHEGLLWLKYQVTRGNVISVCTEIDLFIKQIKNLADSIWIFNSPGNIVRSYP